MRVPLILVQEAAMASVTPYMLGSSPQVLFHIATILESHKTGETSKLVADGVVVLEMIAQTPLVFECAQAEIAKDIMVGGMIYVILEPVPILEDALAKVAIVLMVGRLLHVAQKL